MKRFAFIATIAISHCSAACAFALDTSKNPTGANHQRAHAFADGAGVRVGLFDTVFFGIPAENYIGGRLVAQYDFYNKTPSQSPDPLSNLIDDHERLAAHIIASNDPLNVGVAPQSLIYNAAINDLNFSSRRAASAWLQAHESISLFSLSAQFGPNTNGSGMEALYWDWFAREKDALLVVAASNTGFQIGIPADSYNGITVGAFDQATGARWSGSAYALNGDAQGSEVRGKPDLLAPGVWVGDGISYGGFYSLGSSFAAPHVAGAAALLKSLPLPPGEGGGEGALTDPLDHRGIKALLLNSARKRNIAGPEILSPASSDTAPLHPTFDKDYLNCAGAGCIFQNNSGAGLTNAWSPDEWAYDGTRFSVSKPLDDEQGAGYLDATRAIINLAGGNASPGLVAGIGWDQSVIEAADPVATHTYTLNQAIASGAFLTATLTWDRIALESDGNGVVDDNDTYAFGELANLDLRLLNAADLVIAESISTTDNVEHLHVPLPVDASPGEFKLQVVYNGGATLATDFAIAWWIAPTALVPGDYNLDGAVNALDYEVWRANYGTTTDTSPLIRGDGNSDGRVDGADYTIWRMHFGETLIATTDFPITTVVPECSTLLLSLLAQLTAAVSLRRVLARTTHFTNKFVAE